MKNKKIVVLFLVLFIIILIGGYFGIQYVKNKNEETTMQEIIPQQEISDEQFRQTIVSLYFIDKESQQVAPEARLVDIREIINDPYDKLINFLIEGPKNEKLQKVIPDNTKLLKTYLENDCVVIDFSSDFLNYDKNNEQAKFDIIKTIVNTLTELTEVNGVKFLIDGNTNEEFKDVYVRE